MTLVPVRKSTILVTRNTLVHPVLCDGVEGALPLSGVTPEQVVVGFYVVVTSWTRTVDKQWGPD